MAGDDHLRATSLVGRTLKDKWRLESQLGSGGMASVWSARHRNGKRVAIKLLHPELTRDEHVRRRFLREGYVANKVKHPSVVTILDDDDDGEMVFLVMELLEGETLSERWKRHDRRLGLRYVLRVADEVLDVLAAAHEQEIVHRDIKPANIFVTSADELKVLDFGIAKLHEGPAGTGHTTRLGATLGSPSFMSPEQARARWEFVDARTDLWALGAVMFALLSGRNVHEAKTAQEMLIATATQTARSLRVAWPEAPDVVAAIVDRALAFERGDRWQDARAMQAVVQRALQIDFDRPRAPLPSLVDVSIIAPPPPSLRKTTKTVYVGLAPREEVSEPSEAPEDPALADDSGRNMHTQATGLMPTIRRTLTGSTPPSGHLSSVPPPSGHPTGTVHTEVMAAAVMPSGPPSRGRESHAPQSRGPLPTVPLSSVPPPSDSTTSSPVAAPVEPMLPTLRAPPPGSLRPTVVLGMFIAGGLVAGGVAFGYMFRRVPVAVAPVAVTPVAAATAATVAAAAASPSAEPAVTASAAAPVDSAAAPPAASDSAAVAPAASASEGPPKKKPPRPRQPKGSGKFLQRRY